MINQLLPHRYKAVTKMFYYNDILRSETVVLQNAR